MSAKRPQRRLRYEQIATTEDTGDPVIKAEFEDVGSHAEIIIDQQDKILRVANVDSRSQGDMRRILDDVTQQLGIYTLRFLNPLTEYGSQIEDRLHGFEKDVEEFSHPDGGTVKIETLVGEWDPDRGSDTEEL